MSTSRSFNSLATSRSLAARTSWNWSNAAHQPGAHLAVVVGAERNSEHLETRAVVQLEQLRDQKGGGMLVEIAGQIGNPHLAVTIGLSGPQRRRPQRHLVAGVVPGAFELQRGVVAEAQKHPRIDDRPPGPNARVELGGERGGRRPVADRERAMGHAVERMRMMRLQPERLLVVRKRLLVALEEPGGVAAVEQRIDVVALDRQRLVVAGDRLLVALERQQGGGCGW